LTASTGIQLPAQTPAISSSLAATMLASTSQKVICLPSGTVQADFASPSTPVTSEQFGSIVTVAAAVNDSKMAFVIVGVAKSILFLIVIHHLMIAAVCCRLCRRGDALHQFASKDEVQNVQENHLV
jgi:hypothetical protein